VSFKVKVLKKYVYPGCRCFSVRPGLNRFAIEAIDRSEVGALPYECLCAVRLTSEKIIVAVAISLLGIVQCNLSGIAVGGSLIRQDG